ncbi:hypothetical protein [Pseudoxanthomonas dokdonensis]|uniref:Phytoene synthase n=1 Tax=Pseudoxanthomonas dokdonensis TaxID=344882 RepID=A0A0R0CXQ8_9GAMM|nr:hypothetical protein [Pseudoxanthomonas dokdonensis]KRG70919.1 phytoene synthase [Pseudoxanthomonas dokdonensis]
MADSPALDSFLDKWRQRWPEWSLASVFVAPTQREVAVAWFALLQEFENVLNISGDPLPADAKLAWWGEELRDWSRHRSRHPLGRVLEPCKAPWAALAETLPRLVEARGMAADGGHALALLQPLGEAIAAVEQALFGAAADARVVNVASVQLLASRWLEGEHAGASELAAAKALLAQWSSSRVGGRPRRLWSAFARARLARFVAAGKPTPLPSPMRLLWTAWWAAAGAR